MQSVIGLALMVPEIIRRGGPWTFERYKKPGLNRVNKIVVLVKLLPSRAFPVDGRSAGPHSRKVIG